MIHPVLAARRTTGGVLAVSHVLAGMPSLMNNLISFWNLDEASGVRYDAHNGNHLTDNNTVSQAAGVSAQTGFAAQFVRLNSEFLSRADNPSLSIGNIDFTIACWVWIDSKPGLNMGIISKWGTAPNREYALCHHTGFDRFTFYVSPDGTAFTSAFANAFGSPPLSTWTFIAAWHDSVNDTLNIQINNGTVNSVAYATGGFDSGTAFEIGRIGLSDNFCFDGRVDAAGFWKGRCLTAEELTYLYNAGLGRQYPL